MHIGMSNGQEWDNAYAFDSSRVFGTHHAHAHVDHVPPDPEKASYCTRTIATSGRNECRVNTITGEMFNRAGREVWHVCASSGDDETDVRRWVAWLGGMRMS